MKKKTLVVLSALFFVLVWAPAAMATSCNCAAGTCFSGGSTWPISACPECNCSASGSSAATAPLTTQFLKNNYSIRPIENNALPEGVDYIWNLKPAQQKEIWKKRADFLKGFLEDASRRSKEAAAAAKEAEAKADQLRKNPLSAPGLDRERAEAIAEAERLQGKAEQAELLKETLQEEIDGLTMNSEFTDNLEKFVELILKAEAEEELKQYEADSLTGRNAFFHHEATDKILRRWYENK